MKKQGVQKQIHPSKEIWADDYFIKNGIVHQCHHFDFNGDIIDKNGKAHHPHGCTLINNITEQNKPTQ